MSARPFLAAPLVLAGAAFAAETHGEHHAPSVGDLFWPLLNFLLFLAILYRFVWPVLKTSMADRRGRIAAEIREAERLEEEARAGLAGIERVRAAEKSEGERLLRAIREEGERERAALVRSARQAGERAREDARRVGEQEAARAVLEIRRAVAAEVTRRAEERLRQRLGDAEQARFVAEFLRSVEGGPGR